MNGNRFPASELANALVRLALDADARGRHAERSGDVRAHGVDVRREPGSLGDDGRVDVADFQAAVAKELGGPPQQVNARCVVPDGIGVRKVPADIAFRRRSENRVGDRVADGVGVGIPEQPAVERNRDTAENQRTSLDEPVQVIADAGTSSSGS